MKKGYLLICFALLLSLVFSGLTVAEKANLTPQQSAQMWAEWEQARENRNHNELDEILFEEDFTDGIPEDWENVDIEGNGWIWTWLEEGEPLPWGGGEGYTIEETTPLVYADSDAAGEEQMEAALVTSEIDVTGYDDITLEFDHILRNFDATGSEAWVEISFDDGETWTEVQYWQILIEQGNPGEIEEDYPFSVSLNDFITDQTTFKLRFRYRAFWQYFWAIDNVTVIGDEGEPPPPGPTNLMATHDGMGNVSLWWVPIAGLSDGFIEDFSDGVADDFTFIPDAEPFEVVEENLVYTGTLEGDDFGGGYYAPAIYSDGIAETSVMKVDGYTAAGMALMLRGYSDDGINYWGYSFVITANGYYSVHRIDGDPEENQVWLVNPTFSNQINTGLGQSNTVTVLMAGSSFTLFINGVLSTTVNDDTYESGFVGVGTWNTADYETEVHWDYLEMEATVELDEFIEYNVYRDDVLIGSTTGVTFEDMVPTIGTYNYGVTALYDEGESNPEELEVPWEGTISSIENVQTDEAMLDSLVHVVGIVTQPTNSTTVERFEAYIQDETGYGIMMFDFDPIDPENNLNRGDEVQVTGFVDEYNGMTEIVNFGYVVLSTGNTVPDAMTGTTDEIANNQAMEGSWAEVQGILQEDPANEGSYNISLDDGSGPVTVRIYEDAALDLSDLFMDYEIAVRGVIKLYEDAVQIVPSLQDDIDFITDVEDQLTGGTVPTEFGISSSYPNPFNSSVRIVIGVPQANDIKAEVFDILGRNVASFNLGHMQAGYHNFTWQANGPSGLYFVKVSSGTGSSDIQKLMFVK